MLETPNAGTHTAFLPRPTTQKDIGHPTVIESNHYPDLNNRSVLEQDNRQQSSVDLAEEQQLPSDEEEPPIPPSDRLDIKTKDEAPEGKSERKIKHSVKLDDTSTEGRPSIYLFIFINPLSGDRKGEDLVTLPIQHFRLRRYPQVQVELHNILDEEDRTNGIKNIQLVEKKLQLGQIPPNPPQPTEEEIINSGRGILSDAVQNRQIHVWSAGGDGTVMSVFELLVAHEINLDLVYFSCIPFGTGNDFSQVLGWGRTLPDKNILGQKLQNLEELIADRLEKSEAARLDIWQVKMTCYPDGYVREAGPNQRKDGHDVAEVKESEKEDFTLVRKMSNYMSIGVQGYVGSGFEAHRAGNRLANMFVYAHESSKWVFWRRFPDLSRFIKSISQNGCTLLECPSPDEKKHGKLQKETSSHNDGSIPEMTNDPIDFVIQNIPHIWGREVDLWGEATSGLESVVNRTGPCDPDKWTPQRANDGKLEIMTIENMTSYLKKLANYRDHVSRIGQFDSPFNINFREPDEHSSIFEQVNGKKDATTWHKTKAFVKDKARHKYERKNVICIMCDGEFYKIKDPKTISFDRFAQIWTLGRNDEENQGRLVADELNAREDHV